MNLILWLVRLTRWLPWGRVEVIIDDGIRKDSDERSHDSPRVLPSLPNSSDFTEH